MEGRLQQGLRALSPLQLCGTTRADAPGPNQPSETVFRSYLVREGAVFVHEMVEAAVATPARLHERERGCADCACVGVCLVEVPDEESDQKGAGIVVEAVAIL